MSDNPYRIKKTLKTDRARSYIIALPSWKRKDMVLVSFLFPFVFYWKMHYAITMILLSP